MKNGGVASGVGKRRKSHQQEESSEQGAYHGENGNGSGIPSINQMERSGRGSNQEEISGRWRELRRKDDGMIQERRREKTA